MAIARPAGQRHQAEAKRAVESLKLKLDGCRPLQAGPFASLPSPPCKFRIIAALLPGCEEQSDWLLTTAA